MDLLDMILQIAEWIISHSKDWYWLTMTLFLVRKETKKKDSDKDERTTAGKQMVLSDDEKKEKDEHKSA